MDDAQPRTRWVRARALFAEINGIAESALPHIGGREDEWMHVVGGDCHTHEECTKSCGQPPVDA